MGKETPGIDRVVSLLEGATVTSPLADATCRLWNVRGAVTESAEVACKELDELWALSLVLPGILCFFKRFGCRGSFDSPVAGGGLKKLDSFRSLVCVMTFGGLEEEEVPAGVGEATGVGRFGVATATVAVVAGGSAAY